MTALTTVSLTLTEAEFRLLKNALQTYIADFGHDEADVLLEAQRPLAKLTAVQPG